MIETALFSSEKVEWETPSELFAELNREFGFTLDPCCQPETAKCEKFYTPVEDGLIQDWSHEVVWMNPPYGKEIALWMQKARIESEKGATVVCLVPARTDTVWWHENVERHAEVRFLPGRLRFVGANSSAPFPSAIVIFRPTCTAGEPAG